MGYFWEILVSYTFMTTLLKTCDLILILTSFKLDGFLHTLLAKLMLTFKIKPVTWNCETDLALVKVFITQRILNATVFRKLY